MRAALAVGAFCLGAVGGSMLLGLIGRLLTAPSDVAVGLGVALIVLSVMLVAFAISRIARHWRKNA